MSERLALVGILGAFGLISALISGDGFPTLREIGVYSTVFVAFLGGCWIVGVPWK